MGKTATQNRADLRVDLKDSGSLWSNGELDRCVERAYSDLSRYLPRELIYEESLQFSVSAESFTTPLSTDVDKVVAAESLTGKVNGSTCTIDGQPDVPRPLTATITDADDSITGLVIIISGFDENNQSATETLTYAVGQSKSLAGKQYFKYVSSVELNQVGGTLTGDTLDIGIGAYTTVWVSLGYKPIKAASETITSMTRNTHYYMDYANGRIKAITSGLVANTAYSISYTKSQIAVDLSALAGFIRFQRAEYPIGDVPQTFAQADIFGNLLFITGTGESESQDQLAEDEHARVYYDAVHISPSDFTPGTAPDFLENTVLMVAAAYALYIYSLKHEHQALTDLASVRTDLAAATTAHTALDTALTNLKKYLDNNSAADAAGILAAITSQAADLRTAIETALDSITTYLVGGTAPSIVKYLGDGDAFLNTVAVGGEGQDVPRAYREYAQTCSEIVNGLIAEANARLSNIVTYINQSAGYATIAGTFAREAEDRIAKINAFMQEAAQYANAAQWEMALADRFRTEADDRRNEAYAIWRDRKQYIGDFVGGSTRQMPSY